MDYYIISVCYELGYGELLDMGFPSRQHEMYIGSIMKAKDMEAALASNVEARDDFEKNGLKGMLTALEFFKRLQIVYERGNYESAFLRMDMQMSNRVTNDAPELKLNMLLKTADWQKKLNMSCEINEKLLKELQTARVCIRQSNAAALAELKEE